MTFYHKHPFPHGDWRYEPLGWMLRGVARLPFGVLYLISDVLFVLIYHIVRYRRRVVSDNIRASFPDYSGRQLRHTVRRFYRNFVDYFVETVKLGHISDEEMRRRMVFENMSVVDSLLAEGRSVVVYFSHSFNWEWATSFPLWSKDIHNPKVSFSQVYRPLVNDWFDNYFLHLRSRFHTLSYPKRSVLRDLIREQRDGLQSVCGFMSDQKPSHGDPTHVMRFLHHPTAMITGTETLARRLDMAVVYMDMEKHSRGHYKVTIRLITKTPEALPHMAITERYARLLEQTIRRDPSIWLWSHKRWKIPVKLPQDDTDRNAAGSGDNS